MTGVQTCALPIYHRKVKRGARQVDQYLVEWKGYPISEATWEPIKHLTGSIELVTEFNEQRRIQLSTVETRARQPEQPEQ